MLIKLGILLVLVLGTFIFLGVKISESIKQKEIKLLFFCLYGMSIFTLFNYAISIYFFVALKHKKGPIGPRGKPGPIGDTGEHGVCDRVSCLQKSLQNIIVHNLENNSSFKIDKQSRIAICDFSKKLLSRAFLISEAGKNWAFQTEDIDRINTELSRITTNTANVLIQQLVEIAKYYNDLENQNKIVNSITLDTIKTDFCTE